MDSLRCGRDLTHGRGNKKNDFCCIKHAGGIHRMTYVVTYSLSLGKLLPFFFILFPRPSVSILHSYSSDIPFDKRTERKRTSFHLVFKLVNGGRVDPGQPVDPLTQFDKFDPSLVKIDKFPVILTGWTG